MLTARGGRLLPARSHSSAAILSSLEQPLGVFAAAAPAASHILRPQPKAWSRIALPSELEQPPAFAYVPTPPKTTQNSAAAQIGLMYGELPNGAPLPAPMCGFRRSVFSREAQQLAQQRVATINQFLGANVADLIITDGWIYERLPVANILAFEQTRLAFLALGITENQLAVSLQPLVSELAALHKADQFHGGVSWANLVFNGSHLMLLNSEITGRDIHSLPPLASSYDRSLLPPELADILENISLAIKKYSNAMRDSRLTVNIINIDRIWADLILEDDVFLDMSFGEQTRVRNSLNNYVAKLRSNEQVTTIKKDNFFQNLLLIVEGTIISRRYTKQIDVHAFGQLLKGLLSTAAPSELSNLAMLCTDLDPRKRPADMSTVAEYLQKILLPVPAPEPVQQPIQSTPSSPKTALLNCLSQMGITSSPTGLFVSSPLGSPNPAHHHASPVSRTKRFCTVGSTRSRQPAVPDITPAAPQSAAMLLPLSMVRRSLFSGVNPASTALEQNLPANIGKGGRSGDDIGSSKMGSQNGAGRKRRNDGR